MTRLSRHWSQLREATGKRGLSVILQSRTDSMPLDFLRWISLLLIIVLLDDDAHLLRSWQLKSPYYVYNKLFIIILLHVEKLATIHKTTPNNHNNDPVTHTHTCNNTNKRGRGGEREGERAKKRKCIRSSRCQLGTGTMATSQLRHQYM